MKSCFKILAILILSGCANSQYCLLPLMTSYGYSGSVLPTTYANPLCPKVKKNCCGSDDIVKILGDFNNQLQPKLFDFRAKMNYAFKQLANLNFLANNITMRTDLVGPQQTFCQNTQTAFTGFPFNQMIDDLNVGFAISSTIFREMHTSFYCVLCDYDAQTQINLITRTIAFDSSICLNILSSNRVFLAAQNINLIFYLSFLQNFLDCNAFTGIFDFPFLFQDRMDLATSFTNCYNNFDPDNMNPDCQVVCNNLVTGTISPIFEGDSAFFTQAIDYFISEINKIQALLLLPVVFNPMTALQQLQQDIYNPLFIQVPNLTAWRLSNGTLPTPNYVSGSFVGVNCRNTTNGFNCTGCTNQTNGNNCFNASATFNGLTCRNTTNGINCTNCTNNTNGINCANVTATPFSYITGVPSAAASAAQVAALTNSQLAALNATQMAALTLPQVATITATQMKTLTTAQLAALTTAQMAGLTTAQLAALTITQLNTLTPTQLAALLPSQIPAFTPTQIAAITTTQIAVLTSAQMAALSTSQVPALTTTQISTLTATQIAALTPAQLATLKTTQIAALTPTQIAPLTSAQITALTPTQVPALTTTIMAALTSAQIAALTPTQLKALTTAQITVLTTTQIAALTSTQVPALTTAQIAALTNSQIAALSTTQMAALTSGQITSISLAQLPAVTPAQLAALSVTQLGVMTQRQQQALTTAQMSGLSAAQATAAKKNARLIRRNKKRKLNFKRNRVSSLSHSKVHEKQKRHSQKHFHHKFIEIDRKNHIVHKKSMKISKKKKRILRTKNHQSHSPKTPTHKSRKSKNWRVLSESDFVDPKEDHHLKYFLQQRILSTSSTPTGPDLTSFQQLYDSIQFYFNTDTLLNSGWANSFNLGNFTIVSQFGSGLNLNVYLGNMNFDMTAEQLSKVVQGATNLDPDDPQLNILLLNFNLNLTASLQSDISADFSFQLSPDNMTPDDALVKTLKPTYLPEELFDDPSRLAWTLAQMNLTRIKVEQKQVAPPDAAYPNYMISHRERAMKLTMKSQQPAKQKPVRVQRNEWVKVHKLRTRPGKQSRRNSRRKLPKKMVSKNGWQKRRFQEKRLSKSRKLNAVYTLDDLESGVDLKKQFKV